ncbi:MAG: hypothetical protein HDR50_00725 [Desulfovibrio sp.]|uniref:hypothetical protein n=1 Tax=Desulfovibrio sp. TaxID=885 RepID=UPI001A6A82C7|nr:hypothetical protein [Desulfovibrio sp.]MBD5416216.1 hypothetical protein [Desulfovibrio sp.]MDE7372016.1 hypothetical protein [Desulfovibrio sp.]
MAEFRFENNQLKSRTGSTLGRIDRSEVRDRSGALLVKIINQDIRDRTGALLARVRGDVVEDSHSRKIGSIVGIRKEIDGANLLDPIYAAALWICFIRRGL